MMLTQSSQKGQAEKEVEQLMALKRQLMQEIAEWIDEHHQQADAAAKRAFPGARVFQMWSIRKPVSLPWMR